MSRKPRFHAARRLHSDRAEIGSTLIMMVVFVQVVFLIIHASLVYHGRQVASSAAQEALYAAQLYEGDPGAGVAAGEEVLALSGTLEDTNISVSPGADTVTVNVTGTVKTTLLPFASDVNVTVEGPVEQYLSESKRK